MTLRYELRFIIIIITIIIIIFGRDWLKGNIQTIGPTQSPLGHPPSCRQLSPSLLRSQHQQSLSVIKERRRQINSQLTKASRYTAAWGGTNPQVIKPWIQAKSGKQTNDWNQTSASWDSSTLNMWFMWLTWSKNVNGRCCPWNRWESPCSSNFTRNPLVCLVSWWEYLNFLGKSEYNIIYCIVGILGIFWHLLESLGISRNISGIFWNMLEYLGMFWNILKYVGIQQVFPAPPAALRAIRAISTSAPSPLSVASGAAVVALGVQVAATNRGAAFPGSSGICWI